VLQPDSSTPLYIQLKTLLQERMRSGYYREGSRLPSERELAQLYKVSRMTARQALQLLSQEGLTYARVGKGTYVSLAPIHQQLESLSSFTEEMERLGMKARSLVLRADISPATDALAARFSTTPGTPLVIIKRVRLANEVPVALETTHLVHSMCPGILDLCDLSQDSLYAALRKHFGMMLVRAEQIFEARLAQENEAGLLGIQDTNPVLNIERTTYDSQNRVTEFVRSVYRGDQYRFRATLVSAPRGMNSSGEA
jgi:GntR family transcriptional regulator